MSDQHLLSQTLSQKTVYNGLIIDVAHMQVRLPNGEEMTLEDARNSGAIGLFGDKYGERVKVYSVGDFSKEICGGPHAQNSSQLGKFKIQKEESSSRGVRRIKAVIHYGENKDLYYGKFRRIARIQPERRIYYQSQRQSHI